MFFVLSKLFDIFLHPLSWVILLMLVAVFQKSVRKVKTYALLAIFVAYFFSNAFIFDEINRLWEVDAVSKEELDEHYDLGIILGGLMAYDESSNMMNFDGSADRLLMALPLFKSGRIDKILLSGGSGSLVEEHLEAELLEEYLISIGFKQKDILKESRSRNTYENALYSSELIKKEYPNGNFLLITSASHIRRAEDCFKGLGVQVDLYPVDHISAGRTFYFDQLFLPQAYIFLGWHRLFHEFAGYIAYKISDKC